MTTDANGFSREEHKTLSKKRFVVPCLAVAVLHVVLIFFLGTQKKGFFIDEYFTYLLSNNEYGQNLAVNDNAWNDPGRLLEQFIVSPSQPDSAFNYARVVANNSADVHPPLYYFLFHTLCSLAPGLFSKWTGILLNLPFSLGCLALVGLLAWQLTRNRTVALLTALVYACSPGALTNALFIRMYCMLSFFVLLALWLHALVLRGTLRFGSFLPCIAAVYFCGFMTQYYFIIFAGLLSGACFVYWLCCGRWRAALLYASSLLAALGGTYLFYPAWVDHIFKGYRGTAALENLSSNDTAHKLTAFLHSLNTCLFSYCLPVLAVAIFLAALLCVVKRRQCGLRGLVRACFSTPARRLAGGLTALCTVSFCIIAKISMLTERNFSVRYLLLLFGPILVLCVSGAVWLLCRAGLRQSAAVLCVAALFVCINGFGLVNGSSVEYLFPWQTQLLETARQDYDKPVLVMFDNTLYLGMADLYFQYKQVYFIPYYNQAAITDDNIRRAPEVLVYVQDSCDLEAYSQYIYEQIPTVKHRELMPSPIYHYKLYRFTA